MAKPYSMDLRMRVVEAVDEGEAVDDVAERFGVSARTILSWLSLRKSTGEIAARKGGVGSRPKLHKYRKRIVHAIRTLPSLTLTE